MAGMSGLQKWLGFWISDPIQNPDHLQTTKSERVWILDPHCNFKSLIEFFVTMIVGDGQRRERDRNCVRHAPVQDLLDRRPLQRSHN